MSNRLVTYNFGWTKINIKLYLQIKKLRDQYDLIFFGILQTTFLLLLFNNHNP